MPDSGEGPDERAQDEQDVDRGQEVVLEAELKIGKREIEDEVQNKRQGYHHRKLFGDERLVEDCAERDGDKSVQHRPDRAEDPARWRPERLY